MSARKFKPIHSPTIFEPQLLARHCLQTWTPSNKQARWDLCSPPPCIQIVAIWNLSILDTDRNDSRKDEEERGEGREDKSARRARKCHSDLRAWKMRHLPGDRQRRASKQRAQQEQRPWGAKKPIRAQVSASFHWVGGGEHLLQTRDFQ